MKCIPYLERAGRDSGESAGDTVPEQTYLEKRELYLENGCNSSNGSRGSLEPTGTVSGINSQKRLRV